MDDLTSVHSAAVLGKGEDGNGNTGLPLVIWVYQLGFWAVFRIIRIPC